MCALDAHATVPSTKWFEDVYSSLEYLRVKTPEKYSAALADLKNMGINVAAFDLPKYRQVCELLLGPRHFSQNEWRYPNLETFLAESGPRISPTTRKRRIYDEINRSSPQVITYLSNLYETASINEALNL